MARVLIIGDLHAPFIREGYLKHCKLVQKTYQCDEVVVIGDVIDCHAISRHEKSPQAEGSKTENKRAIEQLQDWYKTFPRVKVCMGNHDDRPYRQASTVGMAEEYMKTINDIVQSPKGWRWGEEFEIDGVIYRHGHTGNDGGRTPHLTLAERRRRSMVVGHYHSVAGIEWSATEEDIIFGMCVGCGIDSAKYAFDYAKHGIKKPIVACGVVIDGWLPILIKQNLGTKVRRLK